MVAGEMQRAITTATRYRVSCLPGDHIDAPVFTLVVEMRADETGFRWAVTRNGVGYYDAEGGVSAGVRWPTEDGVEREPVTDAEWDDYHRRYREWLDAHRFTEAQALGLARRLAPRLEYRGKTVADALAKTGRPQERSERASDGLGGPEATPSTPSGSEAVRGTDGPQESR